MNTEKGIWWLASFPKSGNTWTRSFIANLLHEEPESVDINAFHTGCIASARGWSDEVLGFDTAELSHDEIDRLRPGVYHWSHERAEENEYHKCHDAYTFLPDGTAMFPADACRGALYIMRNPLDVAISYANHSDVKIDRSIEMMADPEACFCRTRKGQANQLRQKLLSWSEHVQSWSDAPDLNLRIVRYEDMRLHPQHTFTGTAEFLCLPHDRESIRQALINCDFELLRQQEQEGNFQERPANATCFFRKGRAGDWQERLTKKQIDRLIKDHGTVMRRFGYLDAKGRPLHPPRPVV
ncbi:MAG: sulfotransferase domain-containing protein [Gammaproteobacteria bacterium]|nr:sulfotransferase domain-containing protein [Gammaproteobacteria bacterium]